MFKIQLPRILGSSYVARPAILSQITSMQYISGKAKQFAASVLNLSFRGKYFFSFFCLSFFLFSFHFANAQTSALVSEQGGAQRSGQPEVGQVEISPGNRPDGALGQITAPDQPAPAALHKDIEQSFILNKFYLASNENLLTTRLSLGITSVDYLHDILREGARLKLECRTEIFLKRSFWKNSMLEENFFSSNLRYDPLQREFLIYSTNPPPLKNRDLVSLLQMTWGNLELPLATVDKLEKGETYVAIVNVALKHEEMPPWLGKNVFFWSDEIIPPTEYSLEFVY